jgi:hypothetical protein
MKLWTALFFLFSVVCSVLSASTPDKFAKYQSLSRSGPVDLDSASYEDLTSTPRDYYAVVILTATDSRFGCLLCRDFEPEWDLIARSWNKGPKQDELKVIFGTLDFDNGKAVFQKVGIVVTQAELENIDLPPNSLCFKLHLFYLCSLLLSVHLPRLTAIPYDLISLGKSSSSQARSFWRITQSTPH